MEARIPTDLRHRLDADDVIQQTFIDAFRAIRSFEPRGPASFRAWLTVLARHRLQDSLRGLRAAKRGGERRRVERGTAAGSVADLLETLRAHTRTPSRSAANHEVAALVREGIAKLKPAYRDAIQLRYLDALPVKEVAARLNRSGGAVYMLCERALAELARILERVMYSR